MLVRACTVIAATPTGGGRSVVPRRSEEAGLHELTLSFVRLGGTPGTRCGEPGGAQPIVDLLLRDVVTEMCRHVKSP